MMPSNDKNGGVAIRQAGEQSSEGKAKKAVYFGWENILDRLPLSRPWKTEGRRSGDLGS